MRLTLQAALMLAGTTLLSAMSVAAASAQTVQLDPPTTFVGISTSPANLVVADFNNDGRLDVAFTDSARGGIHLFYGQGNGALTQVPTLGSPGPTFGLAAGDVNGDGRIDLVAGATLPLGSGLLLFLNNGDGSWQIQMIPGPAAFQHVVLADMNRDGALDIIGSGVLLLNTGGGTFGPALSVPGSVPADFNGDGILDLVGGTGQNVTTSLGNGDGTFQAPTSYQTAAVHQPPVVADVTGDGIPDVLVMQTSSDPALNGIVTFPGRADGTLGAPTFVQTSGGGLVTGDFNDDGFIDVVVAVRTDVPLTTYARVFTDDGEGNFGSPINFPTYSGGAAAAADMNGDGQLDLVTLGGSVGNVAILLNSTSAAGFGSPQPVQWTNLVNTTATGSTLQKSDTCDCGYDASGFSAQQITGGGNAAVEFTVVDPGPLRELGFTTATSGTSPDMLDFSLRVQSGRVEVRERSVYKRDIAVASADVLRISIQDNVVRYILNGAPFYLSATAPTFPLLTAAVFASPGGSIDQATLYGASSGGGNGGGGGGSTITWTQSVNVATTGTTIRTTSACDCGYDASAVSIGQIGSTGFFEFTADGSDPLLVAGLTHAFEDTNPNDIDFGIRLQDGWAEVRENGVYRADTRFAPGDVFRIAVDQGVVTYAINGEVYYTSTVVPSTPLFAAVTFANTGGSISGVMLSAPLGALQRFVPIGSWPVQAQTHSR